MISLSELGFIAERRGDPAAAGSWHLESLTAAQKLGDPQAVAQAIIGLAGAQALGGKPDRAAQLLGAADPAWHSAGASLQPGDSADVNRITAVTRQALGEAAFAAEFQNGRRLRPEQAASLLWHSRRQHRARIARGRHGRGSDQRHSRQPSRHRLQAHTVHRRSSGLTLLAGLATGS